MGGGGGSIQVGEGVDSDGGVVQVGGGGFSGGGEQRGKR